MFVLFFLLLFAAAVLLLKIHTIYRALDDIRRQFAQRMEMDTNIGIDTACQDKKIRELAADLDRQLKLLRKKQILYTRGDKELKTAVTNISHDLRTPLTAIYGYLDLLQKEEMTDTVAQYIAVIQNRVDALKVLAEELFRYSVVLSVDSYREREELSVNAVLEESIAGYYGAIVEAGIQPQINICAQEVKRTLNRQALARIFSNMIGNALKYSDGDFQVRMDADGQICFSNHAEKLDSVRAGYLFDRFYTVESGGGSTGLGLSIARTLTEGMGGAIKAEYRDGVLYIYLSFG